MLGMDYKLTVTVEPGPWRQKFAFCGLIAIMMKNNEIKRKLLTRSSAIKH